LSVTEIGEIIPELLNVERQRDHGHEINMQFSKVT